MAGEISRLFVVVGAKTDEFHKGMDKCKTKMDKVSKAMKISGGIMVAAIAAIGVASLKMAGDFDGAMREVNTMMLLSEDEFKAFSKEIQDLAKNMGVNAVEAANALYQAISAGVPKENAVDFLTVATKAAIGGVTDTKTAVDGLTTVINAFKLPMSDAQKVADIMFTTVKGGKTTFQELSASMFNVAPIAAASGVSFEEVSAALATMTKQGVPTAQATTQLRQAMVALQKPTADMQKVITELGYESGQAMISELGFADTINILRDATGGSNEQLMKMFGSVEAGQAILALTGDNAQMFTDDLDAMANSTGAATDAFDQMEKSTGRQFEKLKVQFQDIAITIGMALMPALKKMLEKITPIIKKIGEWISEHADLTVKILAGVGALGALMLLAGPLLSTIRILIGVFGALKVAMIAVKTQAALMWGAITLGVSLAVIGIIELVNHLGKAKREVRELADTMESEIKTASTTMVNKIKEQNQALIDAINDRRRLWKEAHFERMNQLDEQFWAELRIISPEKFAQLRPLYEEWLGLQETINELTGEQAEAQLVEIETKLAEPELLSPEEITSLELQKAQLQSETLSLEVTTALKDIPDEDIDRYFTGLETAANTQIGLGLSAIGSQKDELLNALKLPYGELIEWLEGEGFDAYKNALKKWGVEPLVTELPNLPELPEGWPYPPGWKELSPPSFPPLQSGGIVRSPTLAMVGEGGPEAVIPLNQSGLAAGGTREVHIHVGYLMGDEISLRKFARLLKPILGEEARRSQFSPIQGRDYFDSGRASL